MRKNVQNFVRHKAAKVPEILVDMALAVIDTSVKEKTGVLLTEIKPICYLDGITIPCMLLCGDQDELIGQDDIKEMFANINTRVKRLRILRGGHSDDRSVGIFKQVTKFCKILLKNTKSVNVSQHRKALAPVLDKSQANSQGIMRDSIA